jgi:TPR repeat protein
MRLSIFVLLVAFASPAAFAAPPTPAGYSYRNYETVLDARAVRNTVAKLTKDKLADLEPATACELALRAVRAAEIAGPDAALELDRVTVELAKMADKPGVLRCRARVLFAKGNVAESLPLFGLLDDGDPLVPALAWARFQSGDGEGALADMERYRAAREKAGELSGIDIAGEIALLQRLGKPVPPQLRKFGTDVPDAPWPRPLVAMQVGAVTEDALVAIAAALPPDAREFALGEAWFFIGQRRLAAGDVAGAQAALRWLLDNGIRSSREYPLARHELSRFEPAAQAQSDLAQASYEGRGTRQDYAEAMRLARLAAAQGNPAAMNLVGVLLSDGLGVTKDGAAAYEWYKRAAELGNSDALLNLGNYYLRGSAQVDKDPVAAVAYIRRSAELGNLGSQAQLAGMYITGNGTAVDYTQALFWAERAAGQGHAGGRRNLAAMLRDGLGVAKNPERAFAVTRAAAEAGDVDAMAYLGVSYDEGLGVAKDARLAFGWFEKAAQKGYPAAQYMVGLAYRNGDGVAADAGKAIEWMEKAAVQGYAPAYATLTTIFMTGARPSDPVRAARYWRQGAELGDKFAQQSLAMALNFGRGVEQDYTQAAQWYAKAGDQGMRVALNNLGDLYETGLGVPQDYARAVSLYRQAGSAGLPMGFISIALLHEGGRGVAASARLAYIYLGLALSSMRSGKDTETLAHQARLAGQLNATERAEADAVVAAWKPGSPFPGDAP